MRTFLRAALIAAVLLLTPSAGASERAHTSLVLAVDVSDSVSSAEYELQKGAYLEALTDPALARLFAGVEVAIVEFGTKATVVVPFSAATSAAAQYALHERSEGADTNIRVALTLALDVLASRRGRKVVDISANGIQSVRGDSCGSIRAEVQRAMREDVTVNALVILDGTQQCGLYADDWFAQMLFDAGFMVLAQGSTDFYRALRRKLELELM